jgi:hypothetical protein
VETDEELIDNCQCVRYERGVRSMFGGRPIALTDRGKTQTFIPILDSQGEIRTGYVRNITPVLPAH